MIAITIRTALIGALALTTLAAFTVESESRPRYREPSASYRVPSGIGHWKARRDREELRRYRGNPGARAILRQKRQNLCRNVPEAC